MRRLLALNGLRISDALAVDIDHLSVGHGHRTLRIVRKGGKQVTIRFARRTARAIDLAIGECEHGPILLGARRPARRPLRRHANRETTGESSWEDRADLAPQPVAQLHHRRPRRRRPATRRQDAASHADPRTTMRYDRARHGLDRHDTYIVSTFVAGAAR
jgi:integrase/recombinase XerD